MLETIDQLPRTGKTFDAVAWPVKEAARHVPLLVLLAGVTVGSLWVHLKRGRPFALLLALIAASAALVQLESTLIMPYFVITYHSYLLFCVVALSLFAAQGVLELARWLTLRLAQRWPWKSAVERSAALETDRNDASTLGS